MGARLVAPPPALAPCRRRHGGLWADATLFCSKAIEAWLPAHAHSAAATDALAPLEFWALRRTVSGDGGVDGASESVRNFLLFARRPGGYVARMLGASLRRFWEAPRFERVPDAHPCYFMWHHLFACLAASYAPFGRELRRVRRNGALEKSQGTFLQQYRHGQLGTEPITQAQRDSIRKGALFKLTYKGTAEASPGSILEHFLRIGTSEGLRATDEAPSFVSSPTRVPRRKQPGRRQQKQRRPPPAEAGVAADGPAGFDAGLGVKF
tara:strand:- start:173 stop:970 length:798 start_codon:yes stop_codon:yes gene_type:complete